MASLMLMKKGDLSGQTVQTSGMHRLVAVSAEANGSSGLWAGFVTMPPGMKSGAHHHGEAESVIYMLSGRARFRWGDRLANTLEAEAGDFVFVPPELVHQEINALDDAPVHCIVVRDRPRDMVVNVDLPEA
jgi:uncharacterized RmlC-like cupin family protein